MVRITRGARQLALAPLVVPTPAPKQAIIKPRKPRKPRAERFTDGSTLRTMMCAFEGLERTFRISPNGSSICRYCLESGPTVEVDNSG